MHPRLLHSLYWLLITVFCLVVGNVDAQVVKHKNYTTYFNQVTHTPDSVVWTLTPAMVTCAVHIHRTNRFTADPKIPFSDFTGSYTHSGYDRGHMMPAEDNSCDMTAMYECFYYSNMMPQVPNLNRRVWKALEADCRHRAKTEVLHISCGGSGSLGHIGSVNIPAVCWKRVNGVLYIMPNSDTVVRYGFEWYKVSK